MKKSDFCLRKHIPLKNKLLMINLIFPKVVWAMDDGICNPTYLKDISMERWEITAFFECWLSPPHSL